MSSRARSLTDPGTLALACMLLLGVSFVIQPQFDPDYWWHVLIGDRILHGSFPRTDPFTFTAQGHSFIVQEWGGEVLLAALSHLGMWSVITAFAAVAGLGVVLSLARARRQTSSNAVLAILALISLSLGRTVFGPRPQMVTFAFIALLLWILDRHRRGPADGRNRNVWVLVPLFAIWGNVHGGFAIGLGLFFVVIVGDRISALFALGEPVSPARQRTMVMVFAASVIAVLVNPNGIGVYRYAIGLLSNGPAQAGLDEWRSPNFHDPEFIPLAALIALLVVIAPRARRIDLADALAAAAAVVLTLYAVRNLSMVIVTSLPLLADGLDDWRERIVAWNAARRRPNPEFAATPAPGLAVFFVAGTLAVVVTLTIGLSARAYRDPRNNDRSISYAVAAADVLCDAPAARVFQPYGAAGWLLYELQRGAGRRCADDRVFIFGDVPVIGPTVFQEYLDATAALSDTSSILDQNRVDAVWQGRGSPLAARLAADTAWRCIWADSSDIIYTRVTDAQRWPTHGAGCPRS